MYSHTLLGWTVWIFLCLAAVTIAFVLAIAVPIFSDLIGIAAALFAAWYTYGLAGFFWLHDVYHLKGGCRALRKRPVGTVLAVLTIVSGAFICVAGSYVSIQVCLASHSSAQYASTSIFDSVAHRGRVRRWSSRETLYLLRNHELDITVSFAYVSHKGGSSVNACIESRTT